LGSLRVKKIDEKITNEGRHDGTATLIKPPPAASTIIVVAGPPFLVAVVDATIIKTPRYRADQHGRQSGSHYGRYHP
jgi:hypothetical protein